MTISLALAAPPAAGAVCSLPALIDRARSRLAEARTSAEVLEARAAAKAALRYAKLLEAANETQADCLSMIKRAELRMADEIDAAQERGEIERPGGDRKIIVRSADNDPDDRPGRDRTINARDAGNDPEGARTAGTMSATYDELGISSQRVAEWRELRDAG